MNLTVSYFNLSRFRLFLIITACYFIIICLSKNILINETVFYNSFSEQLTYERSMKLFEDMNKISWMNYVLTPIFLLIKFTLISIVLYIGVFFLNLHFKISFSIIFRIVIACEIIFVFAGFIKFLWFYLFAGNYKLDDMSFFYPLSLINLFRISEVNKLWVYPLQAVNIFQAAYILLLSYGLNKAGKIEKSESEKVVLFSYMPALFFWVVLITFISMDTSV
jgi:hypothetical protein